MNHKAGFVSIVGKPNAGKSTLMNSLVGEHMSIITPKAQTTRHRIIGILNNEDYQIVFSDTPGIIKPKYGLQKSMMSVVEESFSDADALLLTTDINEKYDESDAVEKTRKYKGPVAVLINKIDKSNQEETTRKISFWQEIFPEAEIIPVSALEKYNIESVLSFVKRHLPEHPPYYDKEELTDRPERFFVSEIIRKQIFNHCKQEIPYSSEVIITAFREEENINRITAEVITERHSQKAILIGKNGSMMKKIATSARIEIERFTKKKIYLEVFVKVIEDWRNRDNYLKQFGYCA